jgi:hypothetical protein
MEILPPDWHLLDESSLEPFLRKKNLQAEFIEKHPCTDEDVVLKPDPSTSPSFLKKHFRRLFAEYISPLHSRYLIRCSEDQLIQGRTFDYLHAQYLNGFYSPQMNR